MDIKKLEADFNAFDLFGNHWALATAGTPDNYNTCTIGWGTFGTLWTRPGNPGAVVTVFLHPGRYTTEFFKNNDTFTVTFFPKEYRKALGYLGSHSGRDGDKVAVSGLTPEAISDSVTFKEAEITLYCRKVYEGQFEKNGVAADVTEYYKANPKTYPVDENGEWQPHYMFIGDIKEYIDKR